MPKGHAGVRMKCFSNLRTYRPKIALWPLVQLVAKEQGWSKPTAHQDEFGEGMPAKLDGIVVAYVTYWAKWCAGSLTCNEC